MATGYDDRDALYGALEEHHLRIGDTQFLVPPTAIQVNRIMKTSRTNILRGRGSLFKNSGYFDRVIEITLFFADEESINNELRPLLSQCKKCPFLPIENTYLNNTHKIDAVTVSAITVQTTPGFPGTLQAQLQFYAFNPYTYISDKSERTFDEMFNWPLFRWYYQRNLTPSKRNMTYYEPLTEELSDDFVFKIAAEDDLAAIRDWRLKRDKLIKDWKNEKGERVGLDFWNWGKKETEEAIFNIKIDEMYKNAIFEKDIHMEEWPIPNLELEDFTISFENIISSVQLQGHESPTHQYLGSQDNILVAKFITNDEEAVASLESLIRRTTYLTREYHKEVYNGFLEFDHQLARLFGVRYVVIEDMVTNTVEGQPGTYEIMLTMAAYNRAQRRLSETKWLTGDIEWDIDWFENSPLKGLLPISVFSWIKDRPLWKNMWKSITDNPDVKQRAIYESKVKEAFKYIEVYPDLELPLYKEVEEAGFKIPNLNDGVFVDPDFFLIYDDPIDYGEAINKQLDDIQVVELRDAAGKTGVIRDGNVYEKDSGKSGGSNSKSSSQRTSGRSVSTTAYNENLSAKDCETLIRKKANEIGVPQVLAVAFAKSFDPQLRQFYSVGQGKNKQFDNIVINSPNIPIMANNHFSYFYDVDFIRDASYIGVMRVSPLFGDAHALGYNLEYNIEQGLRGLKHYLDMVQKTGYVSDYVYEAFGLNPDSSRDAERAMWVGAVAMYLGFEREYDDLVERNKKFPNGLISKIKSILQLSRQTAEWGERRLESSYKSLPVPDYKNVSLQGASRSPTREKSYKESDFKDDKVVFKEMFHDMLMYDRRGRLVRAFPTFFLAIIDEGRFIGSVKLSDQFFGYRAVSDILYTNNRKQASSTLILEMNNVFGNLTDAQKGEDLTHTSLGDVIQTIFFPAEQAREVERSRNRHSNYYNSIMLRTGARVHFRMGYSANPLLMPTLLNGTVTELRNNGDLLTMVVQDDGIEFTNKLKAKADETTKGFLISKKEPAEITDEILTDSSGLFSNAWTAISNRAAQQHSLGIMHFGAMGLPQGWDDFKDFLMNMGLGGPFLQLYESRTIREINMNVYQTTNMLNVEHDNFFNKLFDGMGIGESDEDGININLFDKTPWDIFSVHAAIGSDYIVAVHPFDFRSTLFIGKPYFPIGYGYKVEGDNVSILRKPFRQFHMYDSYTSIVDNSIRATEENMYTVAVGTYMNEGKLDTTHPIYVDTDIWPEKQRTVNIDTQLNAQGVRLIENIPLIGPALNKPFKWYFDEGVAIRIAAAGLRDYVKDMYDGYLTVIGDPAVKPFDQMMIHDDYSGISGPADVKEVNQIMNLDTGFITMIKPDCVVVNSDKRSMAYLSTFFSSVATPVMITWIMRMWLKNKGYTGALPIMNAVWAATRNNLKKLGQRFETTRLGRNLRNWTRLGNRKETGEAASIRKGEMTISKKTADRWKKNGLLKETLKTFYEIDEKTLNTLFFKSDQFLRNRKILGYDKTDINKIGKVSQKASKIMSSGPKALRSLVRGGKSLWGATHALMGPIGLVAYAIETLVVYMLTATISEFIERFLFTRQAVLIAPLTKDGHEWTAGINGHKGSVVTDSPDMWQRLLTNDFSAFLLGFLGADTTQFRHPEIEPYALHIQNNRRKQETQDIQTLAKNFISYYRKRVIEDPGLIERYEQDKKLAAKLKPSDVPEPPIYPAEDRMLLGSGFVSGTDFTTIDLNIPSGISASAIEKSYKGTALAGLGKYFVQVENSVGINGLYLAAHAALETGWGKSAIFRDKNNLFGYAAYDGSAYSSARGFSSPQECIQYVSRKIKENYLTPGGKYYSKKYGPTLRGVNEKYASDKKWADKIASIMKSIAKNDPNFQFPGSVASGQYSEKVTVVGSAGKRKYRLSLSSARRTLVNIRSRGIKNVKISPGVSYPLLRRGSVEALEALAAAYRQQTGQTITLTSAYRAGDPNWHGTGFAVDIDTPDAGRIGGRVRFPKGSKAKRDLEILATLAVQLGWDGVIHGDVDVIASLKRKYPKHHILQRDDHFNHLHLSYIR